LDYAVATFWDLFMYFWERKRNKKPTKTTKKKKKVGKFKKITTKWMGETKMQSEGLEI
jgi:hypothetical protein